MYPSATYGLMPFVKPTHKRQAAKKPKCEKQKTNKLGSTTSTADMKRYKVTLRDRNGYSYTYIIQADTTSSGSMPTLLGQTVSAPRHIKSMPNVMAASASPETQRHALLAQGKEDLSKVGDGEKKGLFNSLMNFIRRRTGTRKSSVPACSVKSKRKMKPMFPKKRQRTISAVSNLDTIQESPEEDDDEYETLDTDSYTHDSSDSTSDVEGEGSES